MIIEAASVGSLFQFRLRQLPLIVTGIFTNRGQTWVAGISAPDHGNTRAAKRSYSAQATLAFLDQLEDSRHFAGLPSLVRCHKTNGPSEALRPKLPGGSAVGFVIRRSRHSLLGSKSGLIWKVEWPYFG